MPTCGGGICLPLSGPVEAQINNGGTAQITTPTPAASVCQLFFGYNTSSESGKVSVDHGTLNMCNEIFVGYHGKCVLSIMNGGVVSTSPVGTSIASLTGSNGTVTVDGQNQDGTKSRWTVTGQRDDRLGRVQQRASGLLQRRREILRAIRGDANANTNLGAYSYRDGYSNSYADQHAHRYTKGKSDAETSTNAKAASHTAAASLGFYR